LDVSATVIARLDNPDSADDDALIDTEEDDAVLAAPVALAIDVDEADAESPPTNPAP
jgi:exoribonuclease-2